MTEFKSWGSKTPTIDKPESVKPIVANPEPTGDIIIRDRFGRIVHRIPGNQSTVKVEDPEIPEVEIEPEPELNTCVEKPVEISNTCKIGKAEISDDPEPDCLLYTSDAADE